MGEPGVGLAVADGTSMRVDGSLCEIRVHSEAAADPPAITHSYDLGEDLGYARPGVGGEIRRDEMEKRSLPRTDRLAGEVG